MDLAYVKDRHDYMRTREVIFGNLDLQSNAPLAFLVVYSLLSTMEIMKSHPLGLSLEFI